ncbi:MAG TPA: phosphoribosyl-AMP cyclohydrolase [Candidatus Omnitrophota bacterium]|nr:phosphoribosyl-AMP cyclohydrolase [Candidatus Omnitrophota bacterium]
MQLKFDEKGLITAVMQDAKTQEVLMVAYMNETAFRKTVETGKAHFFSRSRNKIWLKGETSGHVQTVKQILTDCDRDCLLLLVEQEGGACHLGYRTCFVHKVTPSGDTDGVTQEKVFNPDSVYDKT